MLKPNSISRVRYDKGGDVTERDILVTFVPTPKYQNVKAIDVSHLSADMVEQLLESWNEYQIYLENQQKTLFGFEEFVTLTKGTSADIRWRTFKPNQLKALD